MVFKRRRRRKRYRKKYKRKASVGLVKKLIKHEVGKTRENLKMLSFVKEQPIRTINNANPWRNTILYSLTGGRIYQGMEGQDPLVETYKNMFPLRPMFSNSGIGKVESGGGGGVADSSLQPTPGTVTQGVHSLRGNQCYLNRFRANILITNQGNEEFVTPGGDTISASDPQVPTAQFVRILVFETRRPLGTNSLALQLLLQNSSGTPVEGPAPATQTTSDSVLGFVNLSVVKKIIYDKLIWLNDGQVSSGCNRVIRMNIPLKRKARWNYIYDQTTNPPNEPTINFCGPFIYMAMFSSNEASNDLQVAPRCSMTSLLTYMDD